MYLNRKNIIEIVFLQIKLYISSLTFPEQMFRFFKVLSKVPEYIKKYRKEEILDVR